MSWLFTFIFIMLVTVLTFYLYVYNVGHCPDFYLDVYDVGDCPDFLSFCLRCWSLSWLFTFMLIMLVTVWHFTFMFIILVNVLTFLLTWIECSLWIEGRGDGTHKQMSYKNILILFKNEANFPSTFTMLGIMSKVLSTCVDLITFLLRDSSFQSVSK